MLSFFLIHWHLKKLLFSTLLGFDLPLKRLLSSALTLKKAPGGVSVAVCILWSRPRVTLLNSHTTSRRWGLCCPLGSLGACCPRVICNLPTFPLLEGSQMGFKPRAHHNSLTLSNHFLAKDTPNDGEACASNTEPPTPLPVVTRWCDYSQGCTGIKEMCGLSQGS